MRSASQKTGRPSRSGGLKHQRIFAIHQALGAEAAADVIGDDAQFVRRDFHDLVGDLVAQSMHALAADVQRVSS